MVLFVNHTFEWGVVIARFLSVSTIVLCHCTHLTYFFHQKLREISAVLKTQQPNTLTLRHACGVPAARSTHSLGTMANGYGCHCYFACPWVCCHQHYADLGSSPCLVAVPPGEGAGMGGHVRGHFRRVVPP